MSSSLQNDVGDLPEATTDSSPAVNLPGRWYRSIATLLILGYLALVVLGPLSNPIASAHLTAPLARMIAPVHRALFLGHGYRFFAPNPSASHLVQYKVTREDGTQQEGIFPDRDSIWPRLLYHRWFMLSETVFAEHAQTPSARDFEALKLERKSQIESLKQAGRFKQAQALQRRSDLADEAYERTIKRIDVLVRGISQFLLDRERGEEIELKVVTRNLPFPDEVNAGSRLEDKSFLQYQSNPVIARFSREELAASPEQVPSRQTQPEEIVQ